ncbi:MAG: CPBP family intramembrane metalloprotease [Cytophagales bacterium]|nr:CPBP family intramembrane metalloprotease [Cytophagales bacterium]
MAITIGINYTVHFKSQFIGSQHNSIQAVLACWAFYAFAYYGLALPKLWFSPERPLLGNPKFWLKSAVLILILALVSRLRAYHWVLGLAQTAAEQLFVRRNYLSFHQVVLYFLLIYAFFRWQDRRHISSFYGFTRQGFDTNTYLFMLLFMLPLITGASFTDAFQRYYPRFKPWLYSEPVFGLSDWASFSLYETGYLLRFFTVELVFRGAMVMSLALLIGRHAIVPMVGVYAFLHFSKPLGETVGSVFGGYILGVIALYSRSIFGGCLIHIGVAFLMDMTALVQNLWQQRE